MLSSAWMGLQLAFLLFPDEIFDSCTVVALRFSFLISLCTVVIIALPVLLKC